MKRDEFFETVPLVETIWWDLKNECEFTGAITGTPWNPEPTKYLRQRTVKRAYGKQVHRGCGGDIDYIAETPGNECPRNHMRVQCLRCGVIECIEY